MQRSLQQAGCKATPRQPHLLLFFAPSQTPLTINIGRPFSSMASRLLFFSFLSLSLPSLVILYFFSFFFSRKCTARGAFPEGSFPIRLFRCFFPSLALSPTPPLYGNFSKKRSGFSFSLRVCLFLSLWFSVSSASSVLYWLRRVGNTKNRLFEMWERLIYEVFPGTLFLGIVSARVNQDKSLARACTND